jgi:hypothetical protein
MACHFVYDELGNIAIYYARISEHICYQGHIYIFW